MMTIGFILLFSGLMGLVPLLSVSQFYPWELHFWGCVIIATAGFFIFLGSAA